jgi:hypothetical protein
MSASSPTAAGRVIGRFVSHAGGQAICEGEYFAASAAGLNAEMTLASMDRTLLRRSTDWRRGFRQMNRRGWRVVMYSPEGPINGPLIKWAPGQTWKYHPEESFDWPRTTSPSQEEDD